MADKQQVNNQKELNKTKQEQLAIEREIAAARKRAKDDTLDQVSLTTGIIDDLKELAGIRSKTSTFDSNLLKVNREITAQITNQKSGLTSIAEVQKQQKKNKDDITTDAQQGTLDPKEFASKGKSKLEKKQEKELLKKEREKLDPGFDPKSESLPDRVSSVLTKLKEAKKTGKPQKEIDRLEARLKNLREMAKDRPDTLIHKGTGGRFNRGGLTKTGSMDYRKKGLFY